MGGGEIGASEGSVSEDGLIVVWVIVVQLELGLYPVLSSPYRRLAVIGVKAWFDSILLYIALYCGCIVYRIYTV